MDRDIRDVIIETGVIIQQRDELKRLQEENRLLTMCQCGEFDVEFNRHCNACVKDRIENLQKQLAECRQHVIELLEYSERDEELGHVWDNARAYLEKYKGGNNG